VYDKYAKVWIVRYKAVVVKTVSEKSVGFSSGWSVAGNVAFINQGDYYESSGDTMSVVFGPHGSHYPWAYTRGVGKPWNVVQDAAVDQNADTDWGGNPFHTYDTDGDWHIGTAPSPFRIKWTGH
jgi:hypothetical protein